MGGEAGKVETLESVKADFAKVSGELEAFRAGAKEHFESMQREIDARDVEIGRLKAELAGAQYTIEIARSVANNYADRVKSFEKVLAEHKALIERHETELLRR